MGGDRHLYRARRQHLLARGSRRRVEAAGAQSLCERDAVPLGRDIIHSVTNPIARLTGAIHIYGGDFFAIPRSEWDAETLTEQAYDSARTLRALDEANRSWATTGVSVA